MAGDKTFCIYVSDGPELIDEHAERQRVSGDGGHRDRQDHRSNDREGLASEPRRPERPVRLSERGQQGRTFCRCAEWVDAEGLESRRGAGQTRGRLPRRHRRRRRRGGGFVGGYRCASLADGPSVRTILGLLLATSTPAGMPQAPPLQWN